MTVTSDVYVPGQFALPAGIYLNGNSLGPMPHAAHAAVQKRLTQWQERGVAGWDEWHGLGESLSGSLARLVGAHADEVIATGSITGNLHALLATLYRPQGARRHLLATALDFPTDLYALQSWADREGAQLRTIPSRDGHTLHPDDIAAALTGDIALALLPVVLYRSGQLLDVARWTAEAREKGIVTGWDAAHSVGALPHDLHAAGADFAVWCSYKYLNAGPGAPGGLFVHQRWHDTLPALRGWWGNHKDSQFAMRAEYEPAPGAAAYQQGTPPVLSLAGLEGALSVFDALDIAAVRARSVELNELLLSLVDEHLPGVTVTSPRDSRERGGHLALSHPEARQLSLALRERGVIPDYREPDVLRLSPVALYNSPEQLREVVGILAELLRTGAHRGAKAGGRVS